MIHNDRVRQMVKLETFEHQKGEQYFSVVKYFRNDYVWLHILKAFVAGTVSFGLMVGMWALAEMEYLMETIHTMDLQAFAVSLLMKYFVFIGIYLAGIFCYAHATYTRARREVKSYRHHLQRVIKSFEGDGGDA